MRERRPSPRRVAQEIATPAGEDMTRRVTVLPAEDVQSSAKSAFRYDLKAAS